MQELYPCKEKKLIKIGILSLDIAIITLYVLFRVGIITIDSIGKTKDYFREITGLYCPGCGGTRAIVLFSHGHILKALYYHPAIICLIIYLIIMNLIYWIGCISNNKMKYFVWNPKILYAITILLFLQWLIRNMLVIVWHYYVIPI